MDLFFEYDSLCYGTMGYEADNMKEEMWIRLRTMYEEDRVPKLRMIATACRFAFCMILFSLATNSTLRSTIRRICSVTIKNDDVSEIVSEYKQLIVYGTLVYVGWTRIPEENFFWNSDEYLSDYPIIPLSRHVQFYYTIQLASNLYLVAHPFLQQRDGLGTRMEWSVLVHHTLTLSLVLSSWICNCVRIGALVFLIHDVSTVFLKISRICKSAELIRLRNFAFVAFAATFFVFRVLGMTFVVIPLAIAARHIPHDGFPGLYYGSITMLIMLTILHYFWFSKIMSLLLATAREKPERA